jgi:predicted XRE-type DNA-binding protein
MPWELLQIILLAIGKRIGSQPGLASVIEVNGPSADELLDAGIGIKTVRKLVPTRDRRNIHANVRHG